MTAECLGDPRLVSAIQENAPELERFETELDLARSRILLARAELQAADRPSQVGSRMPQRQFVQRLAVEQDENIALVRVEESSGYRRWGRTFGSTWEESRTYFAKVGRTSKHSLTQSGFCGCIAMRLLTSTMWMSSICLSAIICL